MRISREHYERVARYLDGEDVRLDEAERELSEQIRRDERLLAALDVGLPAPAAARARRRMVAALARPGGRVRWLRWVVGVEAAAVAALLLVAVTLAIVSRGPEGPRAPVVVPTSVLIASTEFSAQSDLDILARQLDELEAELATSVPISDGDVEIDSLERDVQDFLLNGGRDPWEEFSDG